MNDENLLIKYANVDLLQSGDVVLSDISLEVRKGEFLYLIGRVGSGKSSLLKSFYVETEIASADCAQVFEYNLKKLKRRHIPHLRRKLGIVYQDFQLLIDRSVFDNLAFVLKATGWTNKDKVEYRINEVLKQVDMGSKGYRMPHQLSGGEQQRISIARALLNSPKIIIADEPTGHLDSNTGSDIVQLLHNIKDEGTTVIMSTHNLNWIQQYPGRVLHVGDEKIREEEEV